jgi:hypothetical protein
MDRLLITTAGAWVPEVASMYPAYWSAPFSSISALIAAFTSGEVTPKLSLSPSFQ